MFGVGGACKRIHCPLLHLAKVRGLAASALTPWGPEKSWVPLHTIASTRIPVVVLLAPEERGREKG
jgi:hypothetical protein